MLSYITLGAVDLAASVAFYDRVIGTIGWRRFGEHLGFIGYGPEGGVGGMTLWLRQPDDGHPARPGHGVMVAFKAAGRAQVDSFHAEALAAGGAEEGPPGLRETYTSTGYAAYLRDPTGNRLAIVYDGPS